MLDLPEKEPRLARLIPKGRWACGCLVKKDGQVPVPCRKKACLIMRWRRINQTSL